MSKCEKHLRDRLDSSRLDKYMVCFTCDDSVPLPEILARMKSSGIKVRHVFEWTADDIQITAQGTGEDIVEMLKNEFIIYARPLMQEKACLLSK
jgi:hypothetical protein